MLDSANKKITLGPTPTIEIDGASEKILVGSATPKIEIDGANKIIQSTNFQAGAAGFKIQATGDAEFNDITARGKIKAIVFEYEKISVVGGHLAICNGSVLADDITDTDTNIVVEEGAAFMVNDVARIGDGVSGYELIQITAIDGNTLTVTRGYGDTTPQAFTKGTPVYVWDKRIEIDGPSNYLKVFDGSETRLWLGNLEAPGSPAAITGYGLWCDNVELTGLLKIESDEGLELLQTASMLIDFSDSDYAEIKLKHASTDEAFSFYALGYPGLDVNLLSIQPSGTWTRQAYLSLKADYIEIDAGDSGQNGIYLRGANNQVKIGGPLLLETSSGDPGVGGVRFNNDSLEVKTSSDGWVKATLKTGTVGQTELKTAVGSFSFVITKQTTERNRVAVNKHAFASAESRWLESPGANGWIRVHIGACNTDLSYVTEWEQEAYNDNLEYDRDAYTQYTYVQSSPPYELDHFIYLLLTPDGKIRGAWEAPDPPWGHGVPEDRPHPFHPRGGERVVLVDVDKALMYELASESSRKGRPMLHLIMSGDWGVGPPAQSNAEIVQKVKSKGVEFRKLIKKGV